LSYHARYITVEVDTTLANPTLAFELHGANNHRTDGAKGKLILQDDGRLRHEVVGDNGAFRVPWCKSICGRRSSRPGWTVSSPQQSRDRGASSPKKQGASESRDVRSARSVADIFGAGERNIEVTPGLNSRYRLPVVRRIGRND